MRMVDERKAREKRFYDHEYAVNGGNFKLRKERCWKYDAINGTRDSLYWNYLRSDCRGRRFLEYGCGEGSSAFRLGEEGARVVGIDISSVAILSAQLRAEEQHLEKQLAFLVGDCEQLCFQDSSFDVICGAAILHHLNTEKALRAMTHALKPGGRALFVEPLGHNPAIELFRRLTPECRTPDEHPLTRVDLKLIREFFDKVDYHFFDLTSLLAVPFRNTVLMRPILKSLEYVDRKLFELLPFLRLHAWYVLIACEGPAKQSLAL
jgi:ubiquinone/menaquinone biosynthesis C-methylase UbiE